MASWTLRQPPRADDADGMQALDEAEFLAEGNAMDAGKVLAMQKKSRKLSNRQRSEAGDAPTSLDEPASREATAMFAREAKAGKATAITFAQKLLALTIFRVCALCGEKDIVM